jgi:hypothetical protein
MAQVKYVEPLQSGDGFGDDDSWDHRLVDQFNMAMELLGHDSIAVRLGGIFGLERIAELSTSYRPVIVKVLCALVRDASFDESRRNRTDIVSTIETVANLTRNFEGLVINLSNASLEGVDFRGVNMPRGNFTKARLTGAHFEGANLAGATLTKANLTRARLNDADLNNADLQSTHLEGAQLKRAIMRNCDLSGASYDSMTAWPIGFDPTTHVPQIRLWPVDAARAG